MERRKEDRKKTGKMERKREEDEKKMERKWKESGKKTGSYGKSKNTLPVLLNNPELEGETIPCIIILNGFARFTLEIRDYFEQNH